MKYTTSHQEYIPGGKRFWKVGQLYVLRQDVYLYDRKPEFVENRKTERSFNRKWVISTSTGCPIHKGDTFLLLKKPIYGYKHNTYTSTAPITAFYYKLNVLCGDRIGWITLSSIDSPKIFCRKIG